MRREMVVFMKIIFDFWKKHKVGIFEIIAIILISLFSFSLAPKTLQNDTFYTVSIGNLIQQNGIDMKDHFSWHESLPYTYPHWLYDVIMSIIYNLGEATVPGGGWHAIYISVCVLSIVLGITIYEVNKKLNKNQIISLIIAILSMYLLRSYIAARAQLATFIIFMGVIFFIEKFLENPKKIRYAFGIILSSILIANLHVAVWPFLFVIFLPYIAEYIIAIISDIIIYRKLQIFQKKWDIKHIKNNEEKVNKLKERLDEIYISNEKRKKFRQEQEPYKIILTKNKNIKWLIVVMLICSLTGFLTPLKTTPYTYLYNTMQGHTTSNINEHLPLTLINDIPILCTIIIFLAVLTFTKTKIRLADLFMIGGLTYLMFSSKRQSTMFVLLGSLVLNRMISNTIEIYSSKKIEELSKRFINTFIIVLIALPTIYYSCKYIKNKSNDVYVSERSYPVKASEWILKNLDINNIKLFNEYNYGSYLLYKGIPVFIDSRADLYAPEFNKMEKDIFMDFINTSNIGTYYGKTFEEYDITHIILYKNSKIAMLIDETDKGNYNKIYSDDYFVIYEIT